jgi:hypothetical protein
MKRISPARPSDDTRVLVSLEIAQWGGGAGAKIVEFGYDVTGISYTREREHATRDFFTMVLQTNGVGGRKINGTWLPLEKSIAGYPRLYTYLEVPSSH